MVSDPRRTTYETLEAIIVREYGISGGEDSPGVKRLKCHMKWVRTFFGGRRAADITRSDLVGYLHSRRAAGAADSTIKLELSYLRRAYRLAQDEGLVLGYPRFPTIRTYPRRGYFTREQWDDLVAHLPAWWRGAFNAAYLCGWRFRSELLTRTWPDVDREAGVLRLNAGEGKRRRARVFPLTDELLEVLDLQAVTVERLERQLGKRIPWVFPGPTGELQKYPYGVWHRACEAAGLEGKQPHDLRRTFARDLNMAQVPAPAGMATIGHQDEKTYRGYAGEDVDMIRWAVSKVEDLRKRPSNVATFRRRNRTA